MDSLLNRVLASDKWEPGVVDQLLSTVRTANDQDEIHALRKELASHAGESAPAPHRFLEALVRALDGDESGATRVTSMLEALNQRGEWELLASLAIGAAELAGDVALCRYVVRAGEMSGVETLPEGVLDRALDLDPANHRLIWLRGLALEASGKTKESDRAFAGALPAFARARDADRIDEGILRLGDKPELELWLPLWEALDILARSGETRPMVAFLEMSGDKITHPKLVHAVWHTIRHLLAHDETTRKIRAFIPKIAALEFKELKSIDQVIEKSGIAGAKGATDKALKEFDRLLKYAPGLMVRHVGFGAGKILDNDGDTVTIDFKEKEGHQMSLAIAERSLIILSPNDLETYILTEPERMKTLAKEDPVALLVLALEKLGGEGNNAAVRKHLVPGVISAQSWPAWWKRATAAAKEDPRVDTSQTYRRVYRVQDDDAVTAMIPPVNEKAGLHAGVEMIISFLEQHPEHENEARRVYRPRLLQWLGSSHKPADRAHVLLALVRWDASYRDDFHEAVRDLVVSGGDFSFTSHEGEQLTLVAAARLAGLGGDAAFAAFPCRNAQVRRTAARVLEEEIGGDLRRAVRELYSRSPILESRVLGLVEYALEEPDAVPAALEDPWFALRAIIAIVHGAAKEPGRRQARALLKTDGKLATVLAKTPLDEEARHLLHGQLTQWRTTDRHLFPIFEFLESAGGAQVVEDVKKHRSERSAELVQKTRAASEADTGLLMTREGIDRLRGEIQRIELELRTTLPETILRARELGDLKENAEYHAAKEKQANYNGRLGDLQRRLGAARAIEDLPRSPGVAAPGTEVRVRDLDDDSTHTYWILGDGDGFHGNDVISYRAPLGAALVGHRAEEEITVTLEGRERRMQMLSVEARLPVQGEGGNAG